MMKCRRFALVFSVVLCLYVFNNAAIQAASDAQTAQETVPPTLTDSSASGGSPTNSRKTSESKENQWTSRDVAYFLSPFLSLIGVALIVYFTRKNMISEQWLKINTSEAQYIQDKLDKFYGPFIIESQANHLMAQDLRSRQPKPTMHRLLEKLFDEDWRSGLSAGDEALVKDICNTGERLSGVIKEHLGLVDPMLMPYIARAVTHFRILKLACEKQLGQDSKPFLRYVYPKNLDAALLKELTRLQGRLTLLRENPTMSHAGFPQLDLSDCPLDSWPDDPRPNFDPNTGSLTPPSDEGGSLLQVSDN